MAIDSTILIRSTSAFGWRIPASLSRKKREAHNTAGRAVPGDRTGFRAKHASQAGYAAVIKPRYAKFSFCLSFIFVKITPHVLPRLWGVFPMFQITVRNRRNPRSRHLRAMHLLSWL